MKLRNSKPDDREETYDETKKICEELKDFILLLNSSKAVWMQDIKRCKLNDRHKTISFILLVGGAVWGSVKYVAVKYFAQ